MSTESSEASRVHLLAVRKALSNRNAAVMVGSGFSRNADGGENLATWRQLSEALAMELEPDRAPGSFSPASASQLAEQYSRVFSPTHLEQLIKRCVPDDQVTPGPLHNSLLELPWSEVFTTNYDTLLERAAERMFDVSYFTVCSREDIPQSKVLARRRIVKLHGSFPSHRPFILTEEDYRTYPERFAPFVNLVRQSLLENVFCLIGFSGDDPNFLHWLGWVRDMLDKHALPVYLFLSDEPTLGERKLYEARGVIPVLLPAPEGVSRDDFQARYRALFDELKKPLSNSPLDWGSCARLKEKLEEEQGEPQLVALLDHLPMLHACRSTYPGWIVAPREVRRRFQLDSNWLEHALGKKPLRDRLALRPAPVVLTVLEVYFWVQQVTLGPILDSFAELALDLLAKWQASDLERVSGESLEFLAAMDARNADSARRMWTHVALALLTWARQSHRSATYRRISELLAPVARKDTAVHDRLIYEEVLRCLQAGDRPAARHTVLKWRPKGPDAYMHVLRGSLMAEVGDPSAAMPAFEQAIQTLRRQQRSRPGDPELISKEAWACVVANHVQEAAEFGWLVRGDVRRKGATDEKEEKEREDFDGRLNVLVARGYSAREELSSVLAKLNAEAVPPQVESSQLGGFDLGTTSSRRIIGGPTEFRNKVAASFAWLELMERVGLLPQTRNASFFADAMLQAAWWTRFADRSERAIGLLLRANRPDSLKPRDPFLPPHRTGWLGRYQVAQFGEDAATELASEFLLQIELEFDGTRPSSDSGSRAAFLLEAFGRLVIRVRSDSLLVEWGHRLLGLHRSVAFQAEPTAWESSSKAIGRLLEALPSHSQEPLLLQALRLPPVPAADLGVKFHDHQLQRWLEVSEIFQNFSTIGVSVDASPWRHVVDDLLFRLRAPESEEPIASTWRRLEALQGAGILTERDKADVGNILWGHVEPGRWPSIPNAHAIGTLNWPSPHHNAASRLLDRFLSHPLRPFSRGYMQYLPAHKRRSYHIGGIDATVGQIRYVLGKTQPSLSQMQGLIALVDEWIDVDAHDLLADVDDEEVRPSVQGIVAYLDQMLAECVRRLVPRKSSNDCINLIGLICAIDERLEGFRVERFQLHMELVKGGYSRPDSLQAIAKTIIPALRSPDAQLSRRAFRVAFDLLKDEHEAFQDVGRGVFNAVVACTFAETSLCLSHALNVLASLPGTSWHRYLDSSALWLLESALVALSDSVTYERARGVSRIADEEVPLVRFNVFRLAHAMVHIAEVQSKEATSWLESAAHDPLPEIRLERFKDAES